MSTNTTNETEIELKFFLGQVIEPKAVTEFLHQQQMSFQQSGDKLENSYFDTPTLKLARNDIGLRIRTGDGLCEQTIKTAGRVLGGLHQRPEYNTALGINEELPKLNLFPSDIWPNGLDIVQMQQELTAIFSTDFYRTSWHISAKGGLLCELVLDIGTIESCGREEAIAEFELELLSDKSVQAMETLFELANVLVGHFKLRPGVKSKAARGYALWQGQEEHKPKGFSHQELLPLALADRESFYSHLGFALVQLQLGVEYCLSSSCPERGKAISESLLFLKQAFILASENLVFAKKELLVQLEQVIGLYTAVELACNGEKTGADQEGLLLEFCYQESFNRLQLALLKLLIDRA